MSITSREVSTPSYESVVGAGLLDAAGGVATIVLAICGLTGIFPPTLASIAVVVFGAELMARGAMIIAVMSAVEKRSAEELGEYGGGVAALFLVGFGGVTLGILSILAVAQAVLVSVSIIGFGVAMILSGGSGWAMLTDEKATIAEQSPVAGGVPVVAGITAIILGILALVLMHIPASLSLTLAALLVLGASVLVSGGSLGLMLRSLAK